MEPRKAAPIMKDGRVVVRYSALPGWVLPTALTICIASSGLCAMLQLKILPNLGSLQNIVRTFNATNRERDDRGQIDNASVFNLTGHSQLPTDTGTSAVGSNNFQLPSIIPGSTVEERLIFLLLAVALGSGALSLIGKDTRLSLSQDGLTFPSALLPELQFKLMRTWQDISAITMAKKPGSRKSIQLYFNSGGKATIDLSVMSAKDIENFFLGLDQWGSQCAVAPDVVALRHELCGGTSAGASHTALWEEELSAHFAATNFVALTPGKLLQNERFKIVMHMSSGGLSAVYLAEHKTAVVVVKESVIPVTADEATRDKARQMFRREASLLMQLQHPQIARVLDHFVEEGRDYLVLEYIPGMSLRQYIKRNGAQKESTVLDWAGQVAEILDYLHGQDIPIIHRDLTPDNLIITPEGKLVLIDFGAANQFIGQSTGTIVGKQLYIAPEQFRGKAEPASDIYSLGATMHFLLTGKEPEALSTSNPAEINKEISQDTNRLVARCTACEPEERIRTAGELKKALGGELIELPGPPPTEESTIILNVPQYEGS